MKAEHPRVANQIKAFICRTLHFLSFQRFPSVLCFPIVFGSRISSAVRFRLRSLSTSVKKYKYDATSHFVVMSLP